MTGTIRAIGAVVLTTAIVAPAGRTAANRAVDSAAAFARLKALEGSWTAAGSEGRRATTTFEIVANGTVVMEHYRNPAMPGNGHMVTAYHLDGADLILTHYCIAKNQPTLRAERFDPVTSDIQFEFVRASNLATPGAGHMRRAKYRFQDPITSSPRGSTSRTASGRWRRSRRSRDSSSP